MDSVPFRIRRLIICPGFIDLHNHSDGEIERAATRSAVNYVTQGCTTKVTGNCGSGPVDVAEYYEAIEQHGAGTNIAHLIPQGNLRKRVLKSDRMEPSGAQLEEMRQLADKAMRDGAGECQLARHLMRKTSRYGSS